MVRRLCGLGASSWEDRKRECFFCGLSSALHVVRTGDNWPRTGAIIFKLMIRELVGADCFRSCRCRSVTMDAGAEIADIPGELHFRWSDVDGSSMVSTCFAK